MKGPGTWEGGLLGSLPKLAADIHLLTPYAQYQVTLDSFQLPEKTHPCLYYQNNSYSFSGDTMGIVIPNKLQHKHTLRALSVMGGLQLASAALIVNFGFILFLSNLFTVEYLGDVCTFLGLLLLGTGTCTFLIARSSAVFLPLAAIMNALAFIVLWQHTDGNGLLFSRIILYYKDQTGSEQHRAYIFSAITFALCMLCEVLSGLSLIGLEDVLMDAKFDSCVRVEMMVQNAAALENIDLVHSVNA